MLALYPSPGMGYRAIVFTKINNAITMQRITRIADAASLILFALTPSALDTLGL